MGVAGLPDPRQSRGWARGEGYSRVAGRRSLAGGGGGATTPCTTAESDHFPPLQQSGYAPVAVPERTQIFRFSQFFSHKNWKKCQKYRKKCHQQQI